MNSDRLINREWRANEFEYRPAGSDFQHSTETASDWISIELPGQLIEELAIESNNGARVEMAFTNGQAIEDVTPVIAALKQCILTDDTSNHILIETTALEFIALAITSLTNGYATNYKLSIAPRALKRVVDFIEDTLADPISLAQLANEAGMSRFHFAKTFKHATGHSPHNYVINRRLARARELLSQSTRSLPDVATSTGFSSQAHFQTTFKNEVGITPKHYRALNHAAAAGSVAYPSTLIDS